MKLILLLIALLLASPARANERLYNPDDHWSFGKDWTVYNTLLVAGMAGMVFIDVKATQYNLRHGHEESNVFLGPRPSMTKLVTMASLAVVGHTVVAAALPFGLREFWQLTGIYMDYNAVQRNFELGARITF
jgi:hypothetical protein